MRVPGSQLPPRKHAPSAGRRAFTLIELLTVVAILAALVAVLLPAVQAAREAARRTTCQNHLRQIGLALLEWHDAQEIFPTGCVEWRPYGGTTQRQLAWSAYLLPWIDQQALYDRLDLELPFDAAENAAAAAVRIPVYVCPSSRRGDAHSSQFAETVRGPSDYGGIYGERILSQNNPPGGVMLIDQAVAISQIADGTSRTLIVGEDTRHPDGQWINGRNLFDQAMRVNRAPLVENDLFSDHPGGAHGLAADASVHFLSEQTDLSALAAACTRAGGETHNAW
jgi:prepilin-type N-terminal cleavage/methylation domain-containing protein